MKKIKYNDSIEFSNVRDIINQSIKLYRDNNAFIIKHKEGKDVKYENITYELFGKEINALGTEIGRASCRERV